jgi:hypothetical protein
MMKKTIILNETKFNRLTYLLEKEDANMTKARLMFDKYSELGNDYFKNPNISHDVRTGDTATYNEALKKEMNEIVETIYSVYEKISHNLGAIYSRATDEDPKDGEKVTYQKDKWMHPSIFYVEPAIYKVSQTDKKNFLYQCRCYYTLILRLYNGGVPVWANLFFNPKYKVAKADFFKCIKISLGKLERVSVGVLNKETNSYPEGSINWIRNKRANSATEKTYGNAAPILNRDFQPATFGMEQYLKFIPQDKKQKIIDWYIKAQKDPSKYEPYLIKDSKVDSQGAGRRRFGIRR